MQLSYLSEKPPAILYIYLYIIIIIIIIILLYWCRPLQTIEAGWGQGGDRVGDEGVDDRGPGSSFLTRGGSRPTDAADRHVYVTQPVWSPQAPLAIKHKLTPPLSPPVASALSHLSACKKYRKRIKAAFNGPMTVAK